MMTVDVLRQEQPDAINPHKRRFLHLSLLAEGKPIFPVPAHVGQ